MSFIGPAGLELSRCEKFREFWHQVDLVMQRVEEDRREDFWRDMRLVSTDLQVLLPRLGRATMHVAANGICQIVVDRQPGESWSVLVAVLDNRTAWSVVKLPELTRQEFTSVHDVIRVVARRPTE